MVTLESVIYKNEQINNFVNYCMPYNDVQLIASNDGVYSFKGDNDFTPFCDLLKDFYAKDTSKKIRALFKSKGMSDEQL